MFGLAHDGKIRKPTQIILLHLKSDINFVTNQKGKYNNNTKEIIFMNHNPLVINYAWTGYIQSEVARNYDSKNMGWTNYIQFKTTRNYKSENKR